MSEGQKFYDVCIIGAGMAGLSAAIYAAADGMDVVMLEKTRPGGQAWHSPKIDNVLGMPGISGFLLAERTIKQATELGAEYREGEPRKIEIEEPNLTGYPIWVTTKEGYTIDCRTLVIATGKSFTPMGLPGMSDLIGSHVFYGEAAMRGPRLFKRKPVAVIGGGNASAQSVLDLSIFCSRVDVIVRHFPIWSSYLHKQMLERPNIHFHTKAEVVELIQEEGKMVGISVVQKGGRFDLGSQGLFVLAGQSPNTEIAKATSIRMDNQGHIITGGLHVDWPDDVQRTGIMRDPYPLETNIPGIFAIGDCRDGMGHGIAAAMGDGNTVVGSIWHYLRDSHFTRFQALLQRPLPLQLRPLNVSLS